MIRKRYLIPSLVAAGLFKPQPLQASLANAAAGYDDGNEAKLLKIFTLEHPTHFADHRSHRSHRSHSSHSSHRSGYGSHSSHTSHTSHRSGGGGYDVPVYNPPVTEPVRAAPARDTSGDSSSSSPSSTVRPQSLLSVPSSAGPDRASAPSTGSVTDPQGRTARFASIVRRVQIALLGHGEYSGAIDGQVGPATRKALRKFQSAHSLTVTGTITPETLNALKIASD